MAEGANFIPKAVEYVKQAIDADNNKDYETAYSLYLRALDYFMIGLKWEKNEQTKEQIRAKIKEYMDRAETIKGISTKPKKKRSQGGMKTRDEADDEDEEDDPDKVRLRGALEGAIVKETPNVHWNDVAGLEAAKEALKEAVIMPVRFPHLFTGKRRPWKGILLYGPPGTGKSYLAKAVATEAKATFFSVSSSDLVSKWQGESERLVRNLFEMAREAAAKGGKKSSGGGDGGGGGEGDDSEGGEQGGGRAQHANGDTSASAGADDDASVPSPSIIFIDEIDSLCSARNDSESESARRIKTEFLVNMQGVGKGSDGVLVLAATNIPWALDAAIRRRFEKRVYISLPKRGARKAMFRIHLGEQTPHSLSDADFEMLAERTEGFSGSDISVVVRDALLEPVRKLQSSTHFKRVRAFNPYSNRDEDDMFTPCSSSDADAQEFNLMDLDPRKVAVPEVSAKDFLKVLMRSKPTVSPDDLHEQEKFTTMFGESD